MSLVRLVPVESTTTPWSRKKPLWRFFYCFFPPQAYSPSLYARTTKFTTRFTSNDETKCCVSPCRTEVTCHKMHLSHKMHRCAAFWAAMAQSGCPQHSPSVRAVLNQAFLTDFNDVCFCWCPVDFPQPNCSSWPWLRSRFWQGVRGDFDLVYTSDSYKRLSLLTISGILDDFRMCCFFRNWECFSLKLQLKSSWRNLHSWECEVHHDQGPRAPFHALAIVICSWNWIFSLSSPLLFHPGAGFHSTVSLTDCFFSLPGSYISCLRIVQKNPIFFQDFNLCFRLLREILSIFFMCSSVCAKQPPVLGFSSPHPIFLPNPAGSFIS